MIRYRFPTFLVLLLLVVSCNNTDKSYNGNIYFDYIVWGDEETGNITVKLQFRPGGQNGVALSLKEPSRVEFDGQVLLPDSAKFNGIYYEAIVPAAKFSGNHNIVFTHPDGNKYQAMFNFPVISLKTPVAGFVNRQDLVLELEGQKQPWDKIRILLTDTSRYGRGIEKVDTVRNGHIFISANELKNLRTGPVYLEIFREEELSLEETMKAGGRLWLIYQLKREFILQDSVPVSP
jgi:hypothetical protein